MQLSDQEHKISHLTKQVRWLSGQLDKSIRYAEYQALRAAHRKQSNYINWLEKRLEKANKLLKENKIGIYALTSEL